MRTAARLQSKYPTVTSLEMIWKTSWKKTKNHRMFEFCIVFDGYYIIIIHAFIMPFGRHTLTYRQTYAFGTINGRERDRGRDRERYYRESDSVHRTCCMCTSSGIDLALPKAWSGIHWFHSLRRSHMSVEYLIHMALLIDHAPNRDDNGTIKKKIFIIDFQ